MPVSGSGVMLVEYTVPNGVDTGLPPASGSTPRTVWQSMQLPIAASWRPRFTSSASNDWGLGGSTVPMAGRQTSANAALRTSSTTTMAKPIRVEMVIPDLHVRPRITRPVLAGFAQTVYSPDLDRSCDGALEIR